MYMQWIQFQIFYFNKLSYIVIIITFLNIIKNEKNNHVRLFV